MNENKYIVSIFEQSLTDSDALSSGLGCLIVLLLLLDLSINISN